MGKYVQNSLNHNEEVKGIAKNHWIALLPRSIVSAFIFCANAGNASAFIYCLLISILLMAKPLIRYFTTELAFTDKRLIGKTGLINTKTLDSPLNKINNALVSSGLFGKILGYGTIQITTSSGTYTYRGIENSNNFKTNLMNQIDQFDEDKIKKQAEEMAKAIKTSHFTSSSHIS